MKQAAAMVGSSIVSAPSDTDAAERRLRHAYWFPPHVYICRVPGGAIFLDLRRNRYLGVGEAEAYALKRYVANWQYAGPALDHESPHSGETESRILDAIAQSGLLQSHDAGIGPFTPRVDLCSTLRSLEDLPVSLAPIRALSALRFLQCCIWARYALRSSSLYDIVCSIHGFGPADSGSISPSQSDIAHIKLLVESFRRLRPYAFAAHDQCLFHALSLTQFLKLHHVRATWIIGVRVRPWAAHSWVQHDDLILDGTPESVHGYTPILAVRT